MEHLNISAVKIVNSDHKWLNFASFIVPTVNRPTYIVSHKIIKELNLLLLIENFTERLENFVKVEPDANFFETLNVIGNQVTTMRKTIFLINLTVCRTDQNGENVERKEANMREFLNTCVLL